MKRRYELTEEEWLRVKDLLPGREDSPVGRAEDNCLFINGVIWIAKTGASWRDLPERYGKLNNLASRFRRWTKSGVWKRVFQELSIEADLEELMIDSTIVRAHQLAAGASKKMKRDWVAQAEAFPVRFI